MSQPAVTKKEFRALKKKVEELEENLAILTDPDLLEEIQEARERREKGKGIPLSKVKKDLDEGKIINCMKGTDHNFNIC